MDINSLLGNYQKAIDDAKLALIEIEEFQADKEKLAVRMASLNRTMAEKRSLVRIVLDEAKRREDPKAREELLQQQNQKNAEDDEIKQLKERIEALEAENLGAMKNIDLKADLISKLMKERDSLKDKLAKCDRCHSAEEFAALVEKRDELKKLLKEAKNHEVELTKRLELAKSALSEIEDCIWFGDELARDYVTKKINPVFGKYAAALEELETP